MIKSVFLFGLLVGLMAMAVNVWAVVYCPSNQVTVSYVLAEPNGPPLAEAVGDGGDSEIILDENAALEDYLAYASAHNAAIGAAYNRWQSAAARIGPAGTLPDPRFTYRYYIEQVETRVGAQRQSFELAQTLPRWGSLDLQTAAAEEAALAQRERYQDVRTQQLSEVKQAYYECYYLAREIEITQRNVELLEHLEAVVRTNYEAAAESYASFVRVMIDRSRLEQRLATLEDSRSVFTARLNAAMNRGLDEPIAWPTNIAADVEDVYMNEATLAQLLSTSNRQLQAQEHEIARADRQIDLAQQNYWPELTVGVNYIDTAEVSGNMNRPADSGNDPIIAMVSMNIPLWRDRVNEQVRGARADHMAQLHGQVQLRNELQARLQRLIYQYQDAERRFVLYQDRLIPLAQQSWCTTETQLRTDLASLDDLIDIERMLLEFQLARERALVDKAKYLAEIEVMIGLTIPRVGDEE
ncbi:MAG: TolC family protein [Sedimentisphaerales bacterium]|nr:TolC family protein [Sedimentisphaerales bacterium]